MKRIFWVLSLISVAISLVFTSCGASNNMNATADNYGKYENYVEDATGGIVNIGSEESLTTSTADAGNDLASRKLIKNAEMNIQTKTFDDFIESLQGKITEFGGFIESSSIRGNTYTSSSNRSAELTVRIPAEHLNSFKTDVSGLGNVTYYNERLKDVTMTYVDMESHITALKTEQTTLLELLAQAENLDAVLKIQDRLTDVNYELESYQSQLRTYDDLIAYSTIEISVQEVERVTVVEEQNMWQRMGTQFVNNIKDIGDGAENVFVWFVSSLPYLVLIAAVVVAVVLFIRAKVKKAKAKKKPSPAWTPPPQNNG